MVHAGDRRPQHLLEDQVGAMIRMQPGAEIGQAAGGRGEDVVALAREHRLEPGEHRCDPVLQGLAQHLGGALASAQGGASFHQRIQGLDLR